MFSLATYILIETPANAGEKKYESSNNSNGADRDYWHRWVSYRKGESI